MTISFFSQNQTNKQNNIYSIEKERIRLKNANHLHRAKRSFIKNILHGMIFIKNVYQKHRDYTLYT